MPNVRKVLAHLFVAVFTLGSIVCPCPPQASNAAGTQADQPHAHHQGQPDSSAIKANGCDHADCVTDCSRISADFSARDDAAVPCKGGFHPAAIASATGFPSMSPPVPGTWAHPPPHSSELSHETPVARFDRLLD
jgi:hypothetical protein